MRKRNRTNGWTTSYHGDVVDLSDATDIDVHADERWSIGVVDAHRPDARVVAAQTDDRIENSLFDCAEVCFTPANL